MFESEFRYENHVQLTTDKDPLGRPRTQVSWRLSDLDLKSMARAINLLDQGLRDAGSGRIELAFPNTQDAWRAAAEGGKHHMGTTRMHQDPALGVVDPNSRVHGSANLYVTGSSVFPSGGYANPTLTIVALAVRLAGHLQTALPSSP
jgi:choline dehydrogenase-like flavoprotein